MRSFVTGIVFAVCCTAYAEKPQLQLEQGRRAIPLEMAQVVMVEGKMLMTTDWIPCYPGGGSSNDNGAIAGPGCQTVTYSPCGANNLVFDAFQPHATTGEPTNPFDHCIEDPGPNYPWARYSFGATYLNAFVTNDMTVCNGAAGSLATGVDVAWKWGQGPNRPMYVAVFTAETFGDCSLPDSSNYYPGVIIHFANIDRFHGYFFANVDYCGYVSNMLPGPGGAYSIFYAQYDDQSSVFTVDTFTGTQPMIWGIEWGHPGSQTDHQWDDFNPGDGQHALNECRNYAYGLCIDPLCAMIAFRTGGHCDPCDANCDGSINLFDIEPFLDLLSSPAGRCRPCAADTNIDGSINLFDIQGFVTCLGG